MQCATLKKIVLVRAPIEAVEDIEDIVVYLVLKTACNKKEYKFEFYLRLKKCQNYYYLPVCGGKRRSPDPIPPTTLLSADRRAPVTTPGPAGL